MLNIGESIRQRYGSKQGLLKHYKFLLLTLLGYYGSYKRVDWSKVQRLIYVCQGNICRSSLGHGYARSHGIDVDSFGLNCQDDFPADPRAINYAKNLKIDLSGHKTKHIKHYKPQQHDLIIVMEPMHLKGIKKHQGVAQLTMAGLWRSSSNAYIHDPFNTCPEFFSRCEEQVIEASQSILGKVEKS